MSNLPTDAFGSPSDPSIVRRDRLLAALLAEDAGVALVQHSPAFSMLVTTSEAVQVILLPTRDRDARELLPARIAQLMKAVESTTIPLHWVAIGGGADVARVLEEMRAPKGSVGFHQIDDASRYARIRGDELPMLSRACAAMRGVEPLSMEQARSLLEKGRALLQRDKEAVERIRGAGPMPVTMALIGTCALVYLLTFYWGQRGGGADAVNMRGAVNGPLVWNGEWYRLASSMFLHGGIMHIFMNMMALESLGRMLEPLLGSRRLLILYALSGLAGAVTTAFGGAERYSVGASGAVWGLMTGLLGIVLFPRGLLPPLLISRLKSGALRPLLLNVGLSLLPGIDWRAHLGGGIMGFLLGAFLLGRGLVPMEERTPSESEEKTGKLASTIAASLLTLWMASSLAWAGIAQKPWTLAEPPPLIPYRLGETGILVEVPKELTKQVKTKRFDDGPIPATKFELGNIQQSPIALDIIVERMTEERNEQEQQTFLEEERTRLDEEPPQPNAVRISNAKLIKIGNHKALFIEHLLNSWIELRTYELILDSHTILIRTLSQKKRAEGWKNIEEKIIQSIKTAER